MKEGLIKGFLPVAAITAALSACNSGSNPDLTGIEDQLGQINEGLQDLNQGVDALGTTTIPPATTVPPETTTSSSTTTTTEAPQPEDRFTYYATDYQEAYPQLTVEQVRGVIVNIADLVVQIDPLLGFVANTTNSGIERDPENGHPIDYDGPITVNVPEGAYGYISHGHGTLIAPNGFTIDLPWKQNNVYLTYIRGVNDDGTAQDLNQGWIFENFATGFVFKSHAADTRHQEVNTNGQVINLEQFAQDLAYAAMSGTNCGATGCEYTITADLIDAQGIENRDENAWTRVTLFPIYGDDGIVKSFVYTAENMITGEFLPTQIK